MRANSDEGKTKVGYSFMYRHYNDIDVYVEDASCVAMWENLLNVIVAGRCRLTRVIRLGGKANVLAACRKDQGSSPRPRIYIIDGDFDAWRGRRKPRLKHLYQINAYCVENLIIGQAALSEVLRDANPNKAINDILDKLSYVDFESDCIKLFSLFLLYASIFAIGASVPTVSYSVHKLLDTSISPHRISDLLLKSRIRNIQNQVKALARSLDFETAKNEIEARVRGGKLSPERHISGKDYLFPMLYGRSKAALAYRESAETLKARLARHYDVRADHGLKRAIERLLPKDRTKGR